LHFEVFESKEKALSGNESLLTSQFAHTKTDCDAVYAAHAAYAASTANLAKLSLATDNIFFDSTAEQLVARTLIGTGDPKTGLTYQSVIGILTS
jgi:hypothetical protein